MLTSVTKAKGGGVASEKPGRMQKLIEIIDLGDTPTEGFDGDEDTVVSFRYIHGGTWAS